MRSLVRVVGSTPVNGRVANGSVEAFGHETRCEDVGEQGGSSGDTVVDQARGVL